MMRWWNNEAFIKKKSEPEESAKQINKTPPEMVVPYLDEKVYDRVVRPWVFRVRAEVANGEVVCVTGNCDSLGNWKHNQVFVLTKEKDEEG